MELSIDLKLIREIVFKDEQLLKEMLSEWIEDSEGKLIEIKNRLEKNNRDGLFNKIHELKTNFSMIHCYTGIQYCEQLIGQLENHELIQESEIEVLNEMVKSVKQQILPLIESE
jgi:HPt (histidine-containing phosphotransfer) domain-containing protein